MGWLFILKNAHVIKLQLSRFQAKPYFFNFWTLEFKHASNLKTTWFSNSINHLQVFDDAIASTTYEG
jgi:hypothetical protein